MSFDGAFLLDKILILNHAGHLNVWNPYSKNINKIANRYSLYYNVITAHVGTKATTCTDLNIYNNTSLGSVTSNVIIGIKTQVL